MQNMKWAFEGRPDAVETQLNKKQEADNHGIKLKRGKERIRLNSRAHVSKEDHRCDLHGNKESSKRRE